MKKNTFRKNSFCLPLAMELRHYRLVKTIAEEGNIANSSEKLFLTQSALSHQLKEIESELGFKLFLRSRNQWKLSEEGSEILKIAQDLFDRIDRGLKEVKRINSASRGKIRLSTECYSFYHHLPNFIQEMGLLYPEIEIELNLEATHQAISKLKMNEIDIGLVSSKEEEKGLRYFNYFVDELFLIVHKENQFSDKNFIEIEDFKQMHLVIHSFPLETVFLYEKFLKNEFVLPKKISAIPLTELALEFVYSNRAVICMPKWALNALKLNDEEIRFKRIGQKGLKRKHYIVWRSEDEGKKHIQNFISNFKDRFMT